MALISWHQTESDDQFDGTVCLRSSRSTARVLYEHCTCFDVELLGTTSTDNRGTLQPIRAHRRMLQVASKHLYDLFSTNFGPHLKHTFTEISHESLSDIVTFVYTSELNFRADCASKRMQQVLNGAKFLIMPDLESACEKYLASDKHLNLRNCISMLRFALQNACLSLLDSVLVLAAENLPYFISNSEFLELSEKEIGKFLLGKAVISLADADQRCRAAVAWLNHDRMSRDACVGDILDMVPFDLGTISVATLTAAWDNSAIRTKYGEKLMNAVSAGIGKFENGDRRYYSNRIVSDVLWNAGGGNDTWCVIGGANAGTEFVMYEVKRRCWWKLRDLPWTRSYAGACIVEKNNIFLFGGDKDQQISADIDQFDLSKNEWITTENGDGAKLSCARKRVSTCFTERRAFNNDNEQSAYIFGGYPDDTTMQTLDVYYGGKLSLISKAMPVGRYGAAAVCVDDLIFVAGGARIELNNSRLASIEKYDCVTNRWSTVGNLDYGRSSLMSVVMGDDLYLAGGYDGRSGVDVVEVFNARTGRIRRAPSMLKARCAGSGVALDRNTLCVVGGSVGGSNSSSLRSVECFDVRESKWSTGVIVPDMPTANCGFGFVSF